MKNLCTEVWAGLREARRDAEAPRDYQEWKVITSPQHRSRDIRTLAELDHGSREPNKRCGDMAKAKVTQNHGT